MAFTNYVDVLWAQEITSFYPQESEYGHQDSRRTGELAVGWPRIIFYIQNSKKNPYSSIMTHKNMLKFPSGP